ncbi:ribonucleotide-diphosphate reductase subunit beta [Vibrio phage vB_VpS_PG07]|uniref:ribonucleoside-diphosphate reductase n=1 Tax=Vibrio phage vB_VpS_PG07 TaxID=2301664 RepID=A0A385E7M3_9CAUD|nr:ribonucleotide-diphosphate reductase subunit beta [Vibrio phage vB_VpS_PG07]AXQ66719.1 ribonucleotide-diphosphate reductase subunit beta [Vibrio phage vB_VpS_PG07]
MSKFNPNNTGYKKQKYKLFLDEQMGLPDTVNVTYPELEELYQDQVAQIWNEFEVSLTQDRMDMQKAPQGLVRPMQRTISWQMLADAVAARSIGALLLKHVTNPELENLINLWAFFETIHNRTYAHIVKQTFQDPTEMMQETYENAQVIMRSQNIVKAFDALEDLPKEASEREVKRALLRALVALFALEAISFMGSFAVTFAITEAKVFQGIGQLVTLICRDEQLHTRFDYEILNILLYKEGWAAEAALMTEELKAILDEVVQQELDWASYIFEEDNMVGLNEKLLQSYILYMARPVYEALGIPFDFEVIKENPLPYMTKYIDSSKMQAAAQEIQITSYQIGAISDDSDDLDFGDMDFDADFE